MCRNFMHVFCAFALSIFGFLGIAHAVSLGKVDVASHLGEPFYAEVPLNLDKDETIASVFVELASVSDYRVLEVFRDPSVSAVRADVKNDSRGSRVELTSVEAVEAPFFNLVLKVRHGRATHFKKFAVFLDLPRSAKPVSAAKAQVLPVRKASDIAMKKAAVKKASKSVQTVESEVNTQGNEAFVAYDGWARTSKYGPMVFGDTITTVAQRLRVDERYSNQQVMVALFEKNKEKFGQGNINLIKAGTYLDVPSSEEVERMTSQQAVAELKQHNAKWRELTKQGKYAKVKAAQENRYSKRVRIGKQASGVASQPMTTQDSSVAKGKESASAVKEMNGKNAATNDSMSRQADGGKVSAESTDMLAALRQENTDLQQRLNDMEAKVAKLAAAPTPAETAAASDARIKKLEIQLARQSAELEKARKQALGQSGDMSMNMLTWILLGVIGLLVVIAAYLVFAMRGQRTHPVEQSVTEDFAEPNIADVDAEEIDVEEIEVEESSFDDAETGDFTAQPEDDMAHALPELTDEDTSEMEAFQGLEEEADPNVDYLAEADVYMRYGMEDEAEKQVRTALKLREDNKDAHVKLIQILHARGNKDGVEEASSAARSILMGEALASFTSAYDALQDGGESASVMEADVEEVGLDEVDVADDSEALDIDGLDMADFELPDADDADSTDEVEPQAADDSEALDVDGLDMTGFEIPDFAESDATDKAEIPGGLSEETANFDLSEIADVTLDGDDEETVIISDADGESDKPSESDMNSDDSSEDVLDIDGLDFGDLDLGSEEQESTNIEVDKTEMLDATEVLSADTEDDEFGLDLSDLELPEGDAIEEPEASAPSTLETTELEKTVVMGWSKGVPDAAISPVEVHEDLSNVEDDLTASFGDAGSEGLDIDMSEFSSDEDDLASDKKEAVEADDSLASAELNLDDLDVDLDATQDDIDIEEYTSTIQATLSDLGVDDSDIEVLKTDDDGAISLDDLDLSTDGMKSSDLLTDISEDGDSLDTGLELDDLLSDLDDDKDKKE